MFYQMLLNTYPSIGHHQLLSTPWNIKSSMLEVYYLSLSLLESMKRAMTNILYHGLEDMLVSCLH